VTKSLGRSARAASDALGRMAEADLVRLLAESSRRYPGRSPTMLARSMPRTSGQ